MKANHNVRSRRLRQADVVVNISKSKNESKSQRHNHLESLLFVVVNISKSKNESKSQHFDRTAFENKRCGKYQ